MQMLRIITAGAFFSTIIFTSCNETPNTTATAAEDTVATANYGGFKSREQWGEHLVTICACHDCHTPKKYGPQGMELDSSMFLSGHPAQSAAVDVNHKEMQSKGLILTNDLTTWIGPWGVSYTANLTSDATGIGNWKEEQFFKAIREGKFKGLDNNRSILPPMPWPVYKYMTDDELKAIFAYLKSTKPIKNVVPPPVPPMAAPAGAPGK